MLAIINIKYLQFNFRYHIAYSIFHSVNFDFATHFVTHQANTLPHKPHNAAYIQL